MEKNNGYYDLFEYYEKQPIELEKVVSVFSKKIEDGISYKEIVKFHKKVHEIGYTFDWGLDAQPYGLRVLGVQLNQLNDWED
jgi:hypothetical protein